MNKIMVALATVFGLCVGQPAQAGIGFGIPLPIPFLVWTPSDHCGQGRHGSCAPKGHDHTTTASTSPSRRSANTAKAAVAVGVRTNSATTAHLGGIGSQFETPRKAGARLVADES
jgi:hypothetical protein